MTHVEHADASTYCHVLSDQAGVLDRHVPSAEIDHLGTHLAMDRVQGGLTQRNISFGGWTQAIPLEWKTVTPRACWATLESNTLVGEGQRAPNAAANTTATMN